MRKIEQEIKMYFHFTIMSIQSSMCYKINFIMNLIGQLLKSFLLFYLWRSLYLNSNNKVMKGFTLNEMFVYIFLSTITLNFVSNTIDQTIGNEVWNGTIANNLLKPFNYKIKLLFQAFGDFFQGLVTVALPIWIGITMYGLLVKKQQPPSIEIVGWYLLSSILGFILFFLINYSFGLLSFYVTNIWGIRNLKTAILNFLSGSIVPLNFLPPAIQKVIYFLPFSSISYIPVLIYMGKISQGALIENIILQIVWIIILWVISNIIWNSSLKRLTILGG